MVLFYSIKILFCCQLTRLITTYDWTIILLRCLNGGLILERCHCNRQPLVNTIVSVANLSIEVADTLEPWLCAKTCQKMHGRVQN